MITDDEIRKAIEPAAWLDPEISGIMAPEMDEAIANVRALIKRAVEEEARLQCAAGPA